MSSPIISFASQVSHQVTIYLGIPILVFGVIGGSLNVIVFLSLKTFRQSSCALYLTLMSSVGIGYLITGLLTFVMIYGFGIDWTIQSRPYCIFREGFVHICGLTGFTCLCLATIDQFLATCSSPRWQQLSNVRLARWLCCIVMLLWCLYGVAFFTSYDLVLVPSTGEYDCVTVNDAFQQYFRTVHVLVLLCALPISTTVIFGFLAYRNVQQMSYRTVPLVRRELDRQLTGMVLVNVVFNFVVMLPFTIINVMMLNPGMAADPVMSNVLNCARNISILFVYSCFACPFYIYICASERFRQQLIYVLFKMHLQRWCHRNVVTDVAMPRI